MRTRLTAAILLRTSARQPSTPAVRKAWRVAYSQRGPPPCAAFGLTSSPSGIALTQYSGKIAANWRHSQSLNCQWGAICQRDGSPHVDFRPTCSLGQWCTPTKIEEVVPNRI